MPVASHDMTVNAAYDRHLLSVCVQDVGLSESLLQVRGVVEVGRTGTGWRHLKASRALNICE